MPFCAYCVAIDGMARAIGYRPIRALLSLIKCVELAPILIHSFQFLFGNMFSKVVLSLTLFGLVSVAFAGIDSIERERAESLTKKDPVADKDDTLDVPMPELENEVDTRRIAAEAENFDAFEPESPIEPPPSREAEPFDSYATHADPEDDAIGAESDAFARRASNAGSDVANLADLEERRAEDAFDSKPLVHEPLSSIDEPMRHASLDDLMEKERREESSFERPVEKRVPLFEEKPSVVESPVHSEFLEPAPAVVHEAPAIHAPVVPSVHDVPVPAVHAPVPAPAPPAAGLAHSPSHGHDSKDKEQHYEKKDEKKHDADAKLSSSPSLDKHAAGSKSGKEKKEGDKHKAEQGKDGTGVHSPKALNKDAAGSKSAGKGAAAPAVHPKDAKLEHSDSKKHADGKKADKKSEGGIMSTITNGLRKAASFLHITSPKKDKSKEKKGSAKPKEQKAKASPKAAPHDPKASPKTAQHPHDPKATVPKA